MGNGDLLTCVNAPEPFEKDKVVKKLVSVFLVLSISAVVSFIIGMVIGITLTQEVVQNSATNTYVSPNSEDDCVDPLVLKATLGGSVFEIRDRLLVIYYDHPAAVQYVEVGRSHSEYTWIGFEEFDRIFWTSLPQNVVNERAAVGGLFPISVIPDPFDPEEKFFGIFTVPHGTVFAMDPGWGGEFVYAINFCVLPQ